MPEQCNAPQNRDDAAANRPINYQPKTTFRPLNDRTEEQHRAIIAQKIRELNPLCYED
jgi:hypothetical protein